MTRLSGTIGIHCDVDSCRAKFNAANSMVAPNCMHMVSSRVSQSSPVITFDIDILFLSMEAVQEALYATA
jgi:hypothetical protein